MIGTLDKKIYFINILTLLIVTIIIITLLCINLDNQKENIIQNAKNHNLSTARLVASDIERVLYGVEELIEAVHNTEEHINIDHKVMDKILKKNLRPYIMDILVIDGKGKITSWTAKGEKPTITDRDYVKFHLGKDTHETFIGQPKLSKVHKGKWFFAISKSHYFNDEQHIITVILDLEYFNMRYKNSLLNKNATIFIASLEGNMYARYPYKYEYVGKNLNEIKKFADSKYKRKDFDIPSPLDKKNRLATLIKSDIYPIIVGSSVLTDEVLYPWKKQRNNTLIIAVLLITGLVTLTYFYTKLQNKLIILSQTDNLTKLLNRGFFSKLANKEFIRARRFSEELSILMLDIDDFKKINDTYGHQEGDMVIEKMAKSIKSNIRSIDLSARYGGEEFIVLLANTNEDDAYKVAQRIKESFAKKDEKEKATTTVSIGLSSLQSEDKNLEEIIKRADRLLYNSKNSGKNYISR